MTGYVEVWKNASVFTFATEVAADLRWLPEPTDVDKPVTCFLLYCYGL